MKEWEKQYGITTNSLLKSPQGEIPGWRKEGKLAIPPNLTIKREIMRVVHEGLITAIYWTPQKRQDHRPNPTQLLVAGHVSMDLGVHPRVHDLPTKQNRHPPHSPAYVQNPDRPGGFTLPTNCHGPHHRPS